MNILIKKGSLLDFSFDAVVVPRFEDSQTIEGGLALIDEKSGGVIGQIIESGDFTGKLFELSVLYTRGPIPSKRIVLVGLGKRPEFSLDKLRGAFSKTAQKVREINLKEFATSLTFISIDKPLDQLSEAIIEGVYLGLYQFTPFKTLEREKIKELESFIIVEELDDKVEIIKLALRSAEIITKAVYFVRDIVSTPGNEMTPTDLSNEASDIAKRKNVKLKVLEISEMKELGMNALLGVSMGSEEPAKFIVLEYRGGKKADPVAVLVGKGITFDSGGISIKPSEKMDEMKTDMAGGAAVMGAIMAVSDLSLPINVVALIPATENLSGGKALKPGDILKSLSGQTIEVVNTDAEGRLILADALTYAGRFKPEFIIDLATLTGACVIALGKDVIGMMGTDDSLKQKIREAADSTGEKVWELPLWEEYYDLIKSDIADFKNSGGREAGTITAAIFLSKFVGNYPWIHLDIAGPAWLEKDKPYIPKGASGIGVRLLVKFLRNWSNRRKGSN